MKINLSDNTKLNNAIIVPGLGDSELVIKLYKAVTHNWPKKYSVNPSIFEANWNETSESFSKKLNRLESLINSYETNENKKLALIGTSAGASLAFNAYYSKKNKISKLINVHGRLRKGVGLEFAARKSQAFFESVVKCETGLTTISESDKRTILILKGLYDEIVPRATLDLENTQAVTVMSIEHILTGILSFTVYAKKMCDFIKAQ